MKKPPFPLCFVLIALLLSSCLSTPVSTTTYQWYGTTALGRLGIDNTAACYDAHPPKTVDDMVKLMGEAPEAIDMDTQGTYYYWNRFEFQAYDTIYMCNARCLSKDGRKLVSSCIWRPCAPGGCLSHGDITLYNYRLHPAMKDIQSNQELVTNNIMQLSSSGSPSSISERMNQKSFNAKTRIFDIQQKQLAKKYGWGK